MLVREVEHTDWPNLMITTEEAVRIILALINNRNQLVLRCHHLKFVEELQPLEILSGFVGF